MLPVPRSPMVNQSSTNRAALLGTKAMHVRGPAGDGHAMSSSASMAAQTSQVACAEPLANDQVPCSRYPPGTRSARPVGLIPPTTSPGLSWKRHCATGSGR